MARVALCLLVLAARPAAADAGRVRLTLDASAAEAVLAILQERAAARPVGEALWRRLFATEPYARLKEREAGLRRAFTDDDFKRFVLSGELAARAPELQRTLEAWRKADLRAVAERILPYLPSDARVRAKVYPVIKPRPNSFVFDATGDPAIFLYLDPRQSPSDFANTVAHESHHIGYADASHRYQERVKGLPANARKAAEWLGAFGEGLAVLAAAGSADVHPLQDFEPGERVRWDQDQRFFDQILPQLDQFFLDLVDGGFARPEVADHVAFTFFGYRGPWYTVGYRMGALVEKRYGRAVLVECLSDPRLLLARYNRAAAEANASGKEALPLWSARLLEAVGAGGPVSRAGDAAWP
jgi:hypothetical protein